MDSESTRGEEPENSVDGAADGVGERSWRKIARETFKGGS